MDPIPFSKPKFYNSFRPRFRGNRRESRFVEENHVYPDDIEFFLWRSNRDHTRIEMPGPKIDDLFDKELDPPEFENAGWDLIQSETLRRNQFRYLFSHSKLENDRFGTAVVPRRLDQADYIVIIEEFGGSDRLEVPDIVGPRMDMYTRLRRPASQIYRVEQGITRSNIKGRFLIDSRVMYRHFPAFRENWQGPSIFNDGQFLYPETTDGPKFLYPVFTFKLSRVDVTAAWLIITILHGRWPVSWDDMDIPLQLLINTADLMPLFGIEQNTEAWALIRKSLASSLMQHYEDIARHDHPDVGAWLFLAERFKIKHNYAPLWANLVVTTHKHETTSEYSNGLEITLADMCLNEAATILGFVNVGNMRPVLMNKVWSDRHGIFKGLALIWGAFVSHFPEYTHAGFALNEDGVAFNDARQIQLGTMGADISIQGLCQMIKRYSLFAKNKYTHERRQMRQPLDPRKIQQLDAIFDFPNSQIGWIQSRDMNGRPVAVDYRTYWTKPNTLDPDINIPVELDYYFGTTTSLFTYSSGYKGNLIFWRNQRSPRKDSFRMFKKAGIYWVLSVSFLWLWIEFLLAYYGFSSSTKDFHRTWLVILMAFAVYKTEGFMEFVRIVRRTMPRGPRQVDAQDLLVELDLT